MVVVPQEVLSRLQETNSRPLSTPTYTGGLDAEMERILSDKKISDDGEKWKQYQQVLQRFLHVSTANRQPINLPIVDQDVDEQRQSSSSSSSKNITNDIDEEIIDSLPAIYRNESRGLLRAFRRRGAHALRWDPNGTVYVNNQQIPESNIFDIIHSIVRARKMDHLPTGWTEVMNVVKELNIPSTYIGNHSASDFLNRTQTPTSSRVRSSSSFTPARNHSKIPARVTYPPTPDSTPSSGHRRSQQNSAAKSLPFPNWDSFRN